MKETLSRSIIKFISRDLRDPACISPGELDWENHPDQVPVTVSVPVRAPIIKDKPMPVKRFKPVILSGLRLISASRSQGS